MLMLSYSNKVMQVLELQDFLQVQGKFNVFKVFQGIMSTA